MLETCPVRQYPNRAGGHLWLKKDILSALHIEPGKRAVVLVELKEGYVIIKKVEDLQHDDVGV
jgi:hypothetical protein